LTKIIIIDDQEDSIEKLSFLIKKYCPTTTLAGVANTGKDGMCLIKKIQPDIVFLDVEMDDMTGFEMLERLDTINFKVIFTTAHDKYAIKAIRFSALDYLLKPIGKDDLIAAIQRANVDVLKLQPEQVKDLVEISKNKSAKIERITLTTGEGLVFKNISDIIYCEADRNYTTIYLLNKEKLVVSKTLKEIEETLDGSGFFRAHHSHLINVSYIERYVRGDGGYVIMKNGENITVARKRKEALLEFFPKF
jgi:two-component system, LytTR family, response regulator